MSRGSRKLVELFYDVVSPYSWLGFEVLRRYTDVWNINLKLRPAFLGGVYKGSGNRSPDNVPTMRFLTAVAERELGGDCRLEQISRELWMRIWSRDQDISQLASLSEAGLKLGLPGSEVEELVKLATSQSVKDKLKATTEEAVQYGAFGFPLIVCHVNGRPEIFFGSDRFELMAHCIGEKWMGPQPNKLFRCFAKIPSHRHNQTFTYRNLAMTM
ncbi:glutathione S-transferase kappa 1-like isoform X2 [Denticeps clupeoides]|uniref:glutathione S-transferase kappa 1-like isoform X2 n=1 Tax=Denticeps clupeoides TaxID=299321 RepID=UPI0010A4D91A|nr:glutathione S-transferase kappa 1-like isoform X2 [Denticeps clupeoides]